MSNFSQVRSLVQNEITEKISVLLQEYVEEFFNPAIDNAKRNLRLIHGNFRMHKVIIHTGFHFSFFHDFVINEALSLLI